MAVTCSRDNMAQQKLSRILHELGEHLPYSIFGVVFSIILMGILNFIATLTGGAEKAILAYGELFHLFHPSHILFSSLATTAMFWKHDNRSFIKATLIGFIGAIAICGISDILIGVLSAADAGPDPNPLRSAHSDCFH